MVQISKSFAVAALVAAPALAAPMMQSSEEYMEARDFNDVELVERKVSGLASALSTFGMLSTGVSLATGLGSLFKKKEKRAFEEDLLEARDFIDEVDARNLAGLLKSAGALKYAYPALGGLIGVGLGAGSAWRANNKRDFIDDTLMDARDFLDDSFDAREFIEDSLDARDFEDDLDARAVLEDLELLERGWDEPMDVYEREFYDDLD